MKTVSRIISLFLCFALVVISVPTTALAAEQKKDDLGTVSNSSEIIIGDPPEYAIDSLLPDSLKVQGTGEKSLKELQEIDISKVEFPQFISREKAIKREHVNRLKDQESNLNTVIYQNRDGSKTAYIFTNPVKYIDTNGQIKDKSTEIADFEHEIYSYAMLDNNIKAYFPSDITKGVLIESNGVGFKLIPVSQSAVNASFSKLTDRSVLYSNVFGSTVDLQYTTLLNGVKEDIIIREYDGQSSFNFVIEAEDLTASLSQNGQWQLLQNDIPVFVFEDIIIKDSSGKNVLGDMNISSDENGPQIVSINVPTSFLLDSTTKYPVYIDPTSYIGETTYNEDGDPVPAIIDVGLYASNNDFLSADGTNILHLGTVDEGVSKIIYKFPYFYDGEYGMYTGLNQYNIGSAMLNINFLSTSSATVVANPMTTTYHSDTDPQHLYDSTLINAYSTAYSSSTSVSSTGVKQIDITNIVKGWAKYNSGASTAAYDNPENGLILSLQDSSDYATVASTEYGLYDDAYLQLDYSYYGGEYYIYNLSEYKSLRRNSTTALSLNSFSTVSAQKWIFEYLGDDQFYIRSAASSNYALYGSGSSISLNTLPTSPSNNYKWYLTLASGGGVVLQNVASNYVLKANGTSVNLVSKPTSGTTDYNLCRWGILETSSYVPLTDFALSDNWVKPGTSKYFSVKATPSNSSWKSEHYFTWTISDTSKVSLTNKLGQVTGVASGKTTLTLTNKMTGLSRSFTISCGTIREGTYRLYNKGTGRYMDVEGPSTASGAYVQQWDLHTGNSEKWNVILLTNGDYVIQSVYSSKYLRVKDGTTTSGAEIIQFEDYNWTSCRWKIEDTSSGAYRITPMLVSSFAVSVPLSTNANGTNLVQIAYTNNTNYYDEWIFDNIGETHGIENGAVYNIQAAHSDKMVSAASGGRSNGTRINQYEFTPGYQWQRWRINYIGNGEYKIKDMNSGSLLSITASYSHSGAYAQLWEDDGTTGQIFKIRENVDGTYSFMSKCSNYSYALTVVGAGTGNDVRLYQYTDTGTSNQRFNLIESNKAIIIVPGIGGSVLQMGSTYLGYNLFDDKDIFSMNRLEKIFNVKDAIKDDLIDVLNAAKEVGCMFNPTEFIMRFVPDVEYAAYANGIESAILLLTILCDSSGESYHDIIPKQFDMAEVSTSTDKYGFDNTYQTLFENLQEFVTTNSSHEYYDVTFFSYDWRMSCADSAIELENYITQMGYDSVILTCHSMGGLVGSGYMARGATQRNTVEQYISFGTPHWGAVAAPTICLTGDLGIFFSNFAAGQASLFENIGFSLCTEVVIQYVVSNIPSVYELFPTQKYVEATGGYLSYDEGELCTTYSETKNVIASHMKGYKASLMAAAENFHNSLYIGNQHVTTYTNRTLVYSNGYSTVQWLTYDPELFGIYFVYEYSWNNYGDCIVPSISAKMDASEGEVFSTTGDHTGMLSVSVTEIEDIINS